MVPDIRKTTFAKAILALIIGTLLLSVFYLRWQFRDRVTHRYADDELKVTVLSVASANITVVESGSKIIMIDSGNPGHERRIEKLLQQEGYEPGDIAYLILTHGHLDHAGTAGYFQQHYGIKTIGHAGDQELFTQGLRGETCPTSTLARVLKYARRNRAIDPFTVDILVDDDLDLAPLGVQGRIVPLPGHTEGSLVIEMGPFAFVGDLIAGSLFAPGVPTTHFFMCDLEDNRRDIGALLESTGIRTWYPGHFGPLDRQAIQVYIKNLPSSA